MSKSNSRFLIVGIGASAGGIPALEEFFRGLPERCGMAFVIVTHLNPERESHLHEVLGRYTEMDVILASSGTTVVPDTVYVMPENVALTIENGVLDARVLGSHVRERKPIDIFFVELAQDQGEYAVGIILSGGDSDGTLGVKAIKEHGGLTLAQVADGGGPPNPDMPQSAISSGLIDLAIPAGEMGEKLVAFVQGFDILSDLGKADAASASQDLDEARLNIYAILRNQTGHDFSGYKTKTFLRRVRRRMQVKQFEAIDAYVACLRQDPGEVSRLFSDLLINVTNFFRDSDAFAVLESNVIPQLFTGKVATDTIRLWVPAAPPVRRSTPSRSWCESRWKNSHGSARADFRDRHRRTCA